MILVAGAGAAGAGAAYHFALLGARDVVLCDRGEVAGGATSRAMGGVRQQFSTGDEVRLARDSVAFFRELGAPLFEQVGGPGAPADDDRGRDRVPLPAALRRPASC